MKKNTVKKQSESLISSVGAGGRVCNQPPEKTRYERRRDDAILRKERTLMNAVFDTVPGLLYLYTEDGRLVRWNKKHEEIAGYTYDELLNFRIEDWFGQEDRTILAREWFKAFSEGHFGAEMNIIVRDGTKVPCGSRDLRGSYR